MDFNDTVPCFLMNIQVNAKTYRLEIIIAGIFALKETKKEFLPPPVQTYQYAELCMNGA